MVPSSLQAEPSIATTASEQAEMEIETRMTARGEPYFVPQGERLESEAGGCGQVLVERMSRNFGRFAFGVVAAW